MVFDADTRAKHCRTCRRVTPHTIDDDACEWCDYRPDDRLAASVNFLLFYFFTYFVVGGFVGGW